MVMKTNRGANNARIDGAARCGHCLLPGGRVFQEVASLLHACRVRPPPAGTPAPGGRTTPALPIPANQVDRLSATGISDLRVGALLKQVAHEIRLACLRRYVQSRLAF